MKTQVSAGSSAIVPQYDSTGSAQNRPQTAAAGEAHQGSSLLRTTGAQVFDGGSEICLTDGVVTVGIASDYCEHGIHCNRECLQCLLDSDDEPVYTLDSYDRFCE